MPRDSDASDVSLELAILRFWAEGISITQRFSRAEITSVPGLWAAIKAVEALPAAIGWDDEGMQEIERPQAPSRIQDRDN